MTVTDEKPLVVQWRLSEAIELIVKLEPLFACAGWHLGLTGGVLYRGMSMKDLDVICYPHNTKSSNAKSPRSILEGLGWRLRSDADLTREAWAAKGGTDKKHVEIWKTDDGRRVDLMVLK